MKGTGVADRYKQLAEQGCCVLLLAALPFLAYYPALEEGLLALPVEGALFGAPWESARPAGLDTPSHPHASDAALRHYPWLKFLNHAALNNESLFWNPYEGAGVPFYAVWRTRVLSPFSLPYYFLDLERALALSSILKMLVAGLCAFHAARRFGFNPATALFAAATFQWSAPLQLAAGLPMSDVVPWLPLFVVQLERLALGQYRFWPLAALALALMGLGGDPDVLLASCLFGLVFVLLRLRNQHAGRRLPVTAAVYGAAIAFGAGLIGLQLAPFLEYVRASADGGAGQALGGRLRALDLAALLLPAARAGLTQHDLLASQLLHAGMVPLLLLPVWASVRPAVARAHVTRLEPLLWASLAVAALALLDPRGAAAQPWLADLEAPAGRWLGAPAWLVFHGLALALLGSAAIRAIHEMDAAQAQASFARMVRYVPLTWIALFGASAGLGALGGELGAAFLWQLGLAALLAIAIAGFLLHALIRPGSRKLGYGLAALSFGALFAVFAPYRAITPAEQVYPETEFIGKLREAHARVVGGPLLAQWPLGANLVPQLYSPSGVRLARTEGFLEGARRDPLLLRRAGSRDLLLTKEDIQGPFASVRPMLDILHVFPAGAVLFRDLGAEGRAWMAYEGRQTALFDPAALDAKRPPLIEGLTLPEENAGPVAAARIEPHESFDQVVVEVRDTRPGVLVLADAWYPGWRATVNGKPVEIGKVEGAFRGVEVSEGAHEVVFYYEPRSFQIGLIVSAIAALIVAVSLRHVVFGPRRRADLSLGGAFIEASAAAEEG